MDRSFAHCAGPVSRRSFLEVGSLGLGGLALADFLRLRAEASEAVGKSEPDTSIIFLWLTGGIPQMETYDMKPDAPVEYRGELRPISTNVPGVDVSEILPWHAKIADRYTIIRSISQSAASHEAGTRQWMTGRAPRTQFGSVNDAPAGAAVVAKMREHLSRGVPNNISMTDAERGPDQYSLGAAYLGPAYTPFEIPGNPSQPDFKVRNLSVTNEIATRLADRRTLLQGLDHLRRDIDRSGTMEAMDRYNRNAYELLTSERARKAFDLSQESAKTRERYGQHCYGQRTLLARRLVEAGSSFVTVIVDHPLGGGAKPVGTHNNWDCHAINCNIFTDIRWRAPYYDQAVTALIEDVYQRGLDKKVMIVVASEFGHTPRLSHEVGTLTGAIQPGRDHWPRSMSVLVSGGGLRMGQVIGSTDSKGELPKDRPLTPSDLWATMYRHLGIDYTHAFLDHSGRPMPILPFGEPISELL